MFLAHRIHEVVCDASGARRVRGGVVGWLRNDYSGDFGSRGRLGFAWLRVVGLDDETRRKIRRRLDRVTSQRFVIDFAKLRRDLAGPVRRQRLDDALVAGRDPYASGGILQVSSDVYLAALVDHGRGTSGDRPAALDEDMDAHRFTSEENWTPEEYVTMDARREQYHGPQTPVIDDNPDNEVR